MSGSPEPLVVLVLEMFIFLLGCIGLLGLTRDYLVQPALFFVLVLSLLGSSAVVAMALMLHIYLPVMEGTAFMAVRSAWHWSFTVVVTATMLVVAVTQAGRVEQDNWKRILWQSDMRADVSSTTASMWVALVLALAVVVLLLHTVFYTKLRTRVEAEVVARETGRVLVMLAAAAVFVQFVCQEALLRVCAVALTTPCKVKDASEEVAQDYSALVPAGISFGLLLVVDACTCIMRERLREDHHFSRFVFYVLLRALPGVAFALAAFLVVDHSLTVLHVYHIVLGALLLLSFAWSVGSVWFELSDAEAHDTGEYDTPDDSPPDITSALRAAPTDLNTATRIRRGTQQGSVISQRHKKKSV